MTHVILVVEDNERNLKLLRDYVRAHGRRIFPSSR